MTFSTPRFAVTIVGGGFAGTALALHLTRLAGPLPLDVALVEPRAQPGPGLAYSPALPELLLNVRPRNLSVWAEEPGHFADWLARQPEAADGLPEFTSRAVYGRYLQQELAQVLARPAANGVCISHYASSAVAAPLLSDGRRAVQLESGQLLPSNATVLALGNFPPPPPTGPTSAT
ncbi:FAD/NAD(P)-binding protein [Hymenobacter sp. BRD67]|uniref:FAD/NAD(P)-binding protein n=1 Tax=Hymenobacter sp. BRD67 TaxID=2675877 RepID=UPI001567B285|nr:FAD/NAD(P)-binding protein [Hymenobacter sp. BRD67]QKG51579.1 FAD/NAD(P)-binding protein [Hymenobacter sp. BRD67]